MNAKMPELKACFEAAGFEEVRTVLSSGNVVFNARVTTLTRLEHRAVQAMHTSLGRAFATIVRPAAYLQELVARDPFSEFDLPPTAKSKLVFYCQIKPEALSRLELRFYLVLMNQE